MVNKIENKKGSKERIFKAAVNEFSTHGFYGARVDMIAKRASINKAMVFYYFSSKEVLYKNVLTMIATGIIGRLKNSGIVRNDLTPEEYLRVFPETYIGFFTDNPEYLRIVVLGLIQNGELMKSILHDVLVETEESLPKKFAGIIEGWHRLGLINEKNPVHFFLNIVSILIFPLVLKPLPEVLFGKDFDEEIFLAERKESVLNLLKRGMII